MGQQLQLEPAIEQLEQRRSGANTQSYAALLRQCGRVASLAEGRRVHSHIVKYGSSGSRFLANLLVEMYGRCGAVDEAVNVFDGIVDRNVYSWNMMILAFVQNGQLRRGRQTFDSMPSRDVVSWTTMVTAYAQAGNMEEARLLFDGTPQRNQIAWSAMINAYAQNGHFGVALSLFQVMLHEGFRPDQAALLGAVSAAGSVRAGYFVATIEDMARCSSGNPALGNALVSMYRKLGRVVDAKRVFDQMPVVDLISWTSIIAAYAENGVFDDAVTVLLPLMDLHGYLPDRITLITLNGACKEVGYARTLHALAVECGLELELTVANSIITMYGRCGSVEDAWRLFKAIPERNVISWTAMVTANAENGRSSEAVHLVRLMDMEGVVLDKVAFVSLVDACADASAIDVGRCLEESLSGDCVTIEIQNALLNLHATSGKLLDAQRIFHVMACRLKLDTITWNTMMAAYARRGLWRETVDLWREMNLDGCLANDISFLAALSACSYAGALEDGCSLLTMMVLDFGLLPCVDHYACAVDLLARSSRLADAEELVKIMPIEPNHVPWFSLLTGCSDNADLRRGCIAAAKILEQN